jgi:hypothetical protein
MTSQMVSFQSAFLGAKNPAQSGVKNDGAKRLERKLQRHRQQRRVSRELRQGRTSMSGALRACSHSDVNSVGADANGLEDQTSTSPLELLAPPSPTEAPTAADAAGAAAAATPRSAAPVSVERSGPVPDQLAKRGELLCARMSALAATLNAQPLPARAGSVPPLEPTPAAAAAAADAAPSAAATRSHSRGTTPTLAPLHYPQGARFRAWPESYERDRRPRRRTVPETSDGVGSNSSGGGGGGGGSRRPPAQLAPLASAKGRRSSHPHGRQMGGPRGSIHTSALPAGFLGGSLVPSGSDGFGAQQYRAE